MLSRLCKWLTTYQTTTHEEGVVLDPDKGILNFRMPPGAKAHSIFVCYAPEFVGRIPPRQDFPVGGPYGLHSGPCSVTHTLMFDRLWWRAAKTGLTWVQKLGDGYGTT